jgi:hypothetical protein
VRTILADVPSNASHTQDQCLPLVDQVDRVGFLDAFEAEDWAEVDEVILDITRDHPTTLGAEAGATESANRP